MAVNVRDAGALREFGDASLRGPAVRPACARTLLHSQLRALGGRLKACAREPEPRAVHRLRIGTRRAEAGLRLFGPLLPPRRTRRLRRRIRKVRRAAGQVRDLDVLICRLANEPEPGADVLPLLSELRERRSDRADELVHRIRSRNAGRIGRESRKLLERIRVRGETPLAAAEDPLLFLCPAMEEFRSAAQADLSDAADLHRFRKRAKRLRYSVEMLQEIAPCDRLHRMQKALQALQDRLGGINDHAAAAAILSELACSAEDASVSAAARSRLEREQAAFHAERDRFLEWWRSGAEADALRGRFAECA